MENQGKQAGGFPGFVQDTRVIVKKPTFRFGLVPELHKPINGKHKASRALGAIGEKFQTTLKSLNELELVNSYS